MPTTRPLARKARDLEQVADLGESEETPWIVIGGVWLFYAAGFAIAVAIALLAYRLVS